MFQRLLNIPKSNSFFLFGARGTGKSTFLKTCFKAELLKYPECYIDFLQAKTERQFQKEPDRLFELALQLEKKQCSVLIIDEVQKVPKILDAVHSLIENHKSKIQFILTGSSARKLRYGGANLLAGRAFLRSLFPLTANEIGAGFDLSKALSWGTLPRVWNEFGEDNELKIEFLESYASVYLKEEILIEQLVRKVEPFSSFLELSSAQNGTLVNYTKIVRDAQVDTKTVQNFYSILEDTYLGFFLNSHASSVRKRLRKSQKFYFIDLGIARALARHLLIIPQGGTSYFGSQFENFLVSQIYILNETLKTKWRMEFLQTEAGLEIDVILSCPGKTTKLIEIKSTSEIRQEHVKHLLALTDDFPKAEFFCFSLDTSPRKFGVVQALHWLEGLKSVFM
jgi:uncharacterized protein